MTSRGRVARRVTARVGAAAMLVAGLAASAAAQSLAARVDAVKEGTVRFSYAPRPGVCGNGGNGVSFRPEDRDGTGYTCLVGPVRVTLGRSGGQTVSVRTCVACGSSRASRDDGELGEVPAPDAARYLLGIARELGGRNAGEAVSAAALGDAGDLTPGLIAVIRDDKAARDARRQAFFWLGQSRDPKAIQFFRDILGR